MHGNTENECSARFLPGWIVDEQSPVYGAIHAVIPALHVGRRGRTCAALSTHRLSSRSIMPRSVVNRDVIRPMGVSWNQLYGAYLRWYTRADTP